jgi:signal transduction histidine kinase/CheY-like chemotaxis protein
MPESVATVELRFETDVVQARQRARDIASRLGFDHHAQIRIATATSEIARNAFRYATGGRVVFSVCLEIPQAFQVEVKDKGAGIPKLEQILEGKYKSQTGLGMGLCGTRRLMDVFLIQSSEAGTDVFFAKHLPKSTHSLTTASVRKVRDQISERSPDNPYEEIQHQNAELMKTLSDLRSRQEELDLLNRELEDTNRGVVALYAELEDRADYLRRTAELKSAFVSNMSHEFRTPLNSIVSLARLLGESNANPLNNEQQIEVAYIENSATGMLEMVNDLLDMAKIEAGKLQVRAKTFDIADLFGALRGMLKPLLSQTSMLLFFDDPGQIPPLHTDEGKLSQILRNLVSNAIKFTPAGEVRVSATLEGENEVSFHVADTGIGIAESDLESIFQEFGQIENDLQRKFPGTGLGLPLSRNLANLLGGSITVKSQPRSGSTFSVKILKNYAGVHNGAEDPYPFPEIDERRKTVLVLDHNHETQALYQSFLAKSRFQVIGVRSITEARRFLEQHLPAVIICNQPIEARNETNFIRELRQGTQTHGVPILVLSAASEERAALASGATAFQLKPIQAEALLDILHQLTHLERKGQILLIDDQEVSLYVLRQFLPEDAYVIREARSGREGLSIAKSDRPELIFLDLKMEDLDGYSVLAALKQDPDTRAIPVIIHTSRPIAEVRPDRLAAAFDFLPKSALGEDGANELVAAILSRVGIATIPKAEHA